MNTYLIIKNEDSNGLSEGYVSNNVPEFEATLITPNPLSKPKREVEREGSKL